MAEGTLARNLRVDHTGWPSPSCHQVHGSPGKASRRERSDLNPSKLSELTLRSQDIKEADVRFKGRREEANRKLQTVERSATQVTPFLPSVNHLQGRRGTCC